VIDSASYSPAFAVIRSPFFSSAQSLVTTQAGIALAAGYSQVMEPNPYEAPKVQGNSPRATGRSWISQRTILIAALLVPVLAYLTFVALYLVEEARYMERMRKQYEKASPLR
jgi:hypothetical protein